LYNLDILSLICEKNRISYILFSKNFKIIDFSQHVILLADDKSMFKKESNIQDSFWEYIGLEKSILKLLNMSEKSFKIPMISKNSNYYDTEIELYKTAEGEEIFIAYITKKSYSSLKYIETIQEINKKTLLLQNADSKEIKRNYYNLLNKQLVTFHVDLQGFITEANDICCHFLGKNINNLLGSHFSDFFQTRESNFSHTTDKILNAKNMNGEDIFFHANIIPVKNSNIIYENIIICQDITYLKRIEKELEYVAAHDSLTGLANRTLLLNKIDEAIINSQKNDTIFGLCFIDLDKFKPINDTYGHHAGDMLLKHISSLLENFVRDFDTVARIGGDEFIILFKQIESEVYLKTVIQRINELPKRNPLLYNEDDTIPFSFSLGVSIYPNDAKNAKELLDFADKNMYKAKKEKEI